ncbi:MULTISPECIES: nitronate monooxygenase family protein [unclassified Burkholderia]|uniref:NAD(P)H-dependent flavin oxidoreductase n=1 Tax=unclassified Burkholderia TaxID=2613784 RepID=UPI000F57B3C2|nr:MULTISPECIES: nitronate monooxygenase [unclassified Burkholderia]RQR87505.1 nitronate monooxygenase [Burkholderia sp. Bp9011]RQR96854.1 nitronate monooxygenase [Burkholderia sp. Bp9010]RQS07471.1 nitronate monooxygenase [Burkholderia sp. Bp8991]RQS30759.1 nitronate monooxygenase [Burkholderia sp. Bp8995]RQS51552.1 nitronate monooxygenase [Burkholderia sp. Bp8989]
MNRPTDNRTLLRTLGVRTPIIQAPMAGVSTPALAAAVSNAGGLGSLGVGATNADGARKMIRDTRALTDRPFNINLFCHQPARADAAVERAWLEWLAPVFREYGATPPPGLSEIYTSFVADDAMLAMLLEEKPAVVSFHFGLPSDEAIAMLKRAGITLFASATHPDEARQIAAAGIDAIVAQGIEAGGHRGVFDSTAHDDRLGTFALTRLLVRECALPVIAAGGIMDGDGIAAALALGAQAAQLGTAFVACPETSIDDGYRRAILGDAAHRTTFTTAISGRVARGIANRLTALGDDPHAPATPAYPIAYDAGKALHAAAKAKGEFGYGAQWAGQAAPLVRSLPTAELFATLERETRAAIARLQHALD